jgi:hypothetical protein
MATRTKTWGLSGNMLKILALIFMTVDHVGFAFFPNEEIFRIIGRLAMPIFAYMIAEGCAHTRSRLRYFLTIAVVAAVCQAVYYFVMNSLQMCILVTFALSVVMICAMDYASKTKGFIGLCVMGIAFCGIGYTCVFLPQELPGFSVDYGLAGVLLPVVFFAGKNKAEKLMLGAVVLALFAHSSYYLSWYALLALPILALYNGQKGKARIKYLFYIYYPLHLVAIFFIQMLLRMNGGA